MHPDGVCQRHGRAVQVDPIKPTFKAPGIELLKLEYDKPLSKPALKFNLRRYAMADAPAVTWTLIRQVSTPINSLETQSPV
jgi:hypothetical protein